MNASNEVNAHQKIRLNLFDCTARISISNLLTDLDVPEWNSKGIIIAHDLDGSIGLAQDLDKIFMYAC
jgi:hypothetical protein